MSAFRTCRDCGDFIWRDEACRTCAAAAKDEKMSSDRAIRCPACRATIDPSERDWWEYGVFEEGNHDVSCPHCDHDFEVQTWIRHTFESPAMIQQRAPSDDARRAGGGS